MHPNPALAELGFSPQDRVVIIHADDLGMCHAANAAFASLVESGAVKCGSVMVPCPWFSELPDADLPQALLWGESARCHDRLSALRSELSIARPIIDLIGLGEEEAARALDALAPAKESAIS